MTIRSGLASSLGIGTESVWGTAVAPTRWVPHAHVAVERKIDRVESEGIRTGRYFMDVLDSSAGNDTIKIKVRVEAYDHAQGLWFSHAFGGAAISGAGPYTQTYTRGDMSAKSFTMQAGFPSADGTVNPFTWAGCKIEKATLTGSIGKNLMWEFDISAKSETTATALTSVSLSSSLNPVSFKMVTLTVGGASPVVKQFTLACDNKLKTDRRTAGSASILEQFDAGLSEYMWSLDTEFGSLTSLGLYTTFATNTAIVLTQTVGSNTNTITTNTRVDGDSPQLNGRDMMSQPLKAKCVGSTDAAAFQLVTVNSDAAA